MPGGTPTHFLGGWSFLATIVAWIEASAAGMTTTASRHRGTSVVWMPTLTTPRSIERPRRSRFLARDPGPAAVATRTYRAARRCSAYNERPATKQRSVWFNGSRSSMRATSETSRTPMAAFRRSAAVRRGPAGRRGAIWVTLVALPWQAPRHRLATVPCSRGGPTVVRPADRRLTAEWRHRRGNVAGARWEPNGWSRMPTISALGQRGVRRWVGSRLHRRPVAVISRR